QHQRWSRRRRKRCGGRRRRLAHVAAAIRKAGSVMTRFRAVGIAVIAFSVSLGPAWAQFTVTDPGTTERNAITAALKSQIHETLSQEYQRLQRMAERLTTRTTLGGYVQPTPQPAGDLGAED